jgi:hypothetical protein
MTDSRQGASGRMNDSRTCTQSGAKLTHNVPETFSARPLPIYQLDCRARRAPTQEQRMQAEIAKAQTELVLLHGATDVLPFLNRQMTEVMK